MSLLKKKGSSDKEGTSSPSSPSTPLFRKSKSFEPGFSEERPHSQQSCGNKKKPFPSFFSNLFWNKTPLPEEKPESCPPPTTSKLSVEGCIVSGASSNNSGSQAGKKSTSHESINSVQSSSSFSFVNPTKYGGNKVKKGKRIPVDDPNYGKTTQPKSSEHSKKSFGNTLDRIGIRMGLKKKYNLQSCESLQYIDACDESVPIIASPREKPGPPSSKAEDSVGTSQGQSKSTPPNQANSEPSEQLGHSETNPSQSNPPLVNVEFSSKCLARPKQSKQSEEGGKPNPTVTIPLETPLKSDKEKTDSSAQTTLPIKKETPSLESKPEAAPVPVPSEKVETPSKPESITETVKTPPDTPKKENPVEMTQQIKVSKEEPQPCSSRSLLETPSTSQASSSKSYLELGSSNTWSNSNRRKRRAPLPPTVKPGTSVVTDTPNDVPSSSSKSAMLTKFTRIEESPPPPSPSSGIKFEIRPRKKEMSLEPMPVTRPSAAFTYAPSPGDSNTLFSRHHHRFKEHKRSISDGFSTTSSGKIHKPGKKKAPAPPNPFGDPDENDNPSGESSSQQPKQIPVSNSNPFLTDTEENEPEVTAGPAPVVASLPPVQPKPSESKSCAQPFHTSQAPSTSISNYCGLPTLVTVTATAVTNSIVTSTVTTAVTTPVSTTGPEITSTATPFTSISTLSNPTTSTSEVIAPISTNPAIEEILDEIRQNELNDEHERQLEMALDEPPSTPPPPIPTSEASTSQTTTATTATVTVNDCPPTENDIQSAQQTLAALSVASVNKKKETSKEKEKLCELKKEAEKSPFNTSPPSAAKAKPSRPSSIGSVIYESPLALLFGRPSNNNEAGATPGGASSAESSPKTSAKQPWYKRGSSGGIISNPFASKPKPTTAPIKPFTSLVKFSELDKETSRIMEEKRKSAVSPTQQRSNESDQEELDELFASAIATGSEPMGETSHQRTFSTPTRFLTTAQVHPISEGEVPSQPDSTASASNAGNSSPPFQSVHAASKHRHIKPLLTSSPITSMRSEKLAIVSPQTSKVNTSISQSNYVTTSSITSRPTTTEASRIGESEWDCPRCTLKNPNWRILCEICFQRKDTSTQLGSYMSSLLQRVNSEANSNRASTAITSSSTMATPATASVSTSEIKTTSPSALTSITPSNSKAIPSVSSATSSHSNPTSTTPSITSSPSISVISSSPAVTSTTNSITACSSSSTSCIPSVSQQFKAPSVNSGVTQKETNKNSQPKVIGKPNNIPTSSGENLLCQLPQKQNLSEKLISRLHSDPELEELDISKLREVRLAYFQRKEENSDASTPPPSISEQNKVETSSGVNNCNKTSNDKNSAQVNTPSVIKVSKERKADQHLQPQTFSDNEDDFLDNMLQLETNNEPTTSNGLLPCPPSVHPSSSSATVPSTSPTQFQSRFRPKLEAIREGNSQDYTLCYSSSEIAQIYENWQQESHQTKKSIPSGINSQQQHYPCNIPSVPIPIKHPPLGITEHQPSANNRLANSPEENYVNVASNAYSTPTFNDTANFFPSLINYNIAGANPQIFLSERVNYDTMNPGSSRLSYEDYKKTGAIPKGFRDGWSSESSCDTDSSRGIWGRGDFQGFPGGSRGMLDFAQLNFGAYPDQNAAVGKLMKRLEAAIANGDHRLAATLAHDLALMKVSCVVSKINQPYSIRVYVEDRCMQQGPFLVQVSTLMTVHDLKAKIESDWGIPSHLQKWILGRKMAEDESASLSSFEMGPDSMAFLFLVSPDMVKVNNKNQESSSAVSEPLSPSLTNLIKGKIEGRPTTPINIPTGHTYDVIGDDKDVHLYNNLDKVKPAKLVSKGESSGESSKKTSTAAQTAVSSISPPTEGSRGDKMKEKSPSPPPRPPKSPIPPAQTPSTSVNHAKPKPLPKKEAQTSQSITKQSENLNKSPISNAKQLNLTKVSQPQQKSGGESAATILTQSLQQKLAEFKQIAEHTFGKTGGIRAPRSSSRERSPAPPPTPPPQVLKKTEGTDKVVMRRGSRGIRSSSRERPVENASERLAKEKSESSSPVRRVENRFNGQILPSSDSGENLKPPERLDRVKNSDKRMKSSSPDISESEKPEPQKRHSGVFRKPPLPPQLEQNTELGKATTPTSASTEPDKKPEEDPSPAPQPKPRGLKKQQLSIDKNEKISVEQDIAPQTASPVSTPAPTPTPRTSHGTGPSIGASDGPKSGDISSSMEVPQTIEVFEEPSQSVQGTVVDDSCQTTLPFPARHKNNDQMQSSMAPSPPKQLANSTPTGNLGNTGLLRPSAFVSQIKPEPNASPVTTSSVLLPILNANFTHAKTLASFSTEPTPSTSTSHGPIAIAHVQPLKITPKPSKPPPTAYVSPSTSVTSPTSSSTSKPATPPAKKDDKEDQQSFMKMLEELMEKQDLIPTNEDAECPVCFSFIPMGSGVVLRDCLHTFCKECLVGCVQYADESTVKCPFRDNSYACNYNLQEREIKALVPPEIFEKYLARSVKLAENQSLNSYHCKTPDCSGWCVFEADVNNFLCPVCKKRNCINCAAIHEGKDCQSYQRELAIAAETDEDAKQSRLMLEKMIQRGEALDCPACHVVLLKKWGCDWVRCSYCKTEICWITKGFRWGKGGKGDTSGGCKCGVNGVKCHPKCTYCH